MDRDLLARIRGVLRESAIPVAQTDRVAAMLRGAIARGGIAVIDGPTLSGKTVATTIALEDLSAKYLKVSLAGLKDGKFIAAGLCRAMGIPVQVSQQSPLPGQHLAFQMINREHYIVFLDNAHVLVTKGRSCNLAVQMLSWVQREFAQLGKELTVIVAGESGSLIFANELAYLFREPAQRLSLGVQNMDLGSTVDNVKTFTDLITQKVDEKCGKEIFDPEIIDAKKALTIATRGRLGMICRLLEFGWLSAQRRAPGSAVLLEDLQSAWDGLSHNPDWLLADGLNPFSLTENSIRDETVAAALGIALPTRPVNTLHGSPRALKASKNTAKSRRAHKS